MSSSKVRWVSWRTEADDIRMYSLERPAWSDDGPPMVPQYRMPGELEVWVSEPGLTFLCHTLRMNYQLAASVVANAAQVDEQVVLANLEKAGAVSYEPSTYFMEYFVVRASNGVVASDVYMSEYAARCEAGRLSRMYGPQLTMRIDSESGWFDFYRGYLAHPCLPPTRPLAEKDMLRERVRRMRVRRA